MTVHPLTVRCEPDRSGWRCSVVVGADPAATTHQVMVTADDVRRFGPAGTRVQSLVEESFRFLLEREPRESILRAFDLPVIGRYFRDYEREIHRRLGG